MMSDFLAASQHDAETNAQHKSFSTAQKSTYNSHSTQEGHVVPYQTKQHSEHQRTLTKRITFPRSANHKIIHLTTMLLFTFSTSLVNNHPVEKYPTECNIKQISGRRPILQIDDHAKKKSMGRRPTLQKHPRRMTTKNKSSVLAEVGDLHWNTYAKLENRRCMYSLHTHT